MNDVAVLAHVEAFRGHHDIESLVPRHIAQAQRYVALHRVRNNDIAAGRFCQKLQYGARFNVLEVQRQALTFVFLGLRKQVRTFVCGLRCGVDLDRKLVVRLIGKLLILAIRRNNDARIQVGTQSIDRGDRGREVHNIPGGASILRASWCL